MSARLDRLLLRRKHLVAQAAEQRAMLAQSIEPWRTPLARVDQGLVALRFVRSHPAIGIVGVAALLAALRLGRVGKWLQIGWVAWQMKHKLHGK
ncbi:MAG: YqjK family protein [Gallionella sp.]|nr:YqjK family protein [Gallionella sp.]